MVRKVVSTRLCPRSVGLRPMKAGITFLYAKIAARVAPGPLPSMIFSRQFITTSGVTKSKRPFPPSLRAFATPFAASSRSIPPMWNSVTARAACPFIRSNCAPFPGLPLPRPTDLNIGDTVPSPRSETAMERRCNGASKSGRRLKNGCSIRSLARLCRKYCAATVSGGIWVGLVPLCRSNSAACRRW